MAGRNVLYTDEKYIEANNIIAVLTQAISDHAINRNDCNKLLEFEGGFQPILRKKTFRPDIDNCVVDNVAAEITDFWLGFSHGNPVSFVQHKSLKEPDELLSKALLSLNDCYRMTGNSKKAQDLGYYLEVCGIGFSYIDINTEYEEGESYFTRDILDPRNAFVVRSRAYTDHRVILGVSFQRAKDGTTYYTCFTKTNRYEITSDALSKEFRHLERSGEVNPLGLVPIIEWERTADRTGCFEKQITECNSLNLLVSDMVNDVDQNTQAVWWANDVEFPVVEAEKTVVADDGTTETVTVEQEVKPQSGEWVETFTPADGKAPSIKPLTLDYDYDGMLNNVLARRQLILQKCHVPQRNDNSGGSTGVAMDAAAGWADAESYASTKESTYFGAQMDELRVVLRAIKENPYLDVTSPLKDLKACDIDITVRRPKNHEMTVKTNAIATLIKTGFSIEDVISAIPMFPDNSQVITRSGETVRAYQESQLGKTNSSEETTSADILNQVGNSPLIDGMNANG